MWRSIVEFLTPIRYTGDDNKTRSAQSVHWISLGFMLAVLLFEIFSKAFEPVFDLNIFDLILLIVLLGLVAVWYLGRAGFVFQAGTILTVFLWVAINAIAYSGFGVRDSAFLGNFIVLLAAGLLIGWKGSLALSVLTVLIGFAFAYAEVNGISRAFDYFTSPYTTIQAMSIVFIIFAGLIYFLINSLEGAISRSQANARELETANSELTAARSKLEENRNELLIANERLSQRADRINTIANISKTITLVQEIEQVLSSVVTTINDRLGYYHVGIYLLDESKQVAILRAASSDGGHRMMNDKFRAVISPADVIGSVLDRGEARILLDEGPGAYKFTNQYLPDTRSQLILPLKVREVVTGALDIHASQPNAFMQEDVSTLQILADQVAIAIQNARSSEAALQSLQKAEVASRQLTGKAWQEYTEKLDRKGYRYDGIKPEPLKEADSQAPSKNQLTIPVRLRGQVIGRLKLKPPETSRQWTDDEIAIAEATAERVALALEGARLLDDAQRKTQQETFLSNVSSKLGSSFQLDSILRDTVEELGQTFENTTVTFQLVNPIKTSGGTKSDSHSTSGNGKDGNHS